MAHLDQLEQAYVMDLLTRLTESIENYLDDDRSGILPILEAEIKESNRTIRKYYKRIQKKELNHA